MHNLNQVGTTFVFLMLKEVEKSGMGKQRDKIRKQKKREETKISESPR